MLVSIQDGELKKLDTTEYKGCSEFVKTGIVYSALLDIHLPRKRKFIFANVHSTSLFFPVTLVSQRKDITSHANVTVLLFLLYHLTVTVAISLECINMIPDLSGIFAQRFV